MKNKLYLLLLLSLTFACKKADNTTSTTGGSAITTDPSKPTLNMDVNDTFWQGTDPYADASVFGGTSDSTYSIHAGGPNSSVLLMAFSKIIVGKQQSFLGITSYSIGRETYVIGNGSITITSYNMQKNIISGTFIIAANDPANNKAVFINRGYFANVNLYR